MIKKLLFTITLMIPAGLAAQQVADTTYRPSIPNPAYSPGEGPVRFT